MGRLIQDKHLKKLKVLSQQAKVGTYFGTPPAESGCETMSEYLSKYLEDTIEWDKNLTDQEMKEAIELYRGAHEGDKDARQELQTLRIEQTNNYLIPMLRFGMFFEVRTLADNESPAVQNMTKNEFSAAYIGQDGGKEKKKAVPQFNESTIDLFTIATDEVDYPLVDIYRGRIAEAAKTTFDLNFDLANRIEANLYTLLSNTFGAFTLTGAKAARTYVPNSRIRAGILPTTNDLSIPSKSGSTTFGQSTLDTIVDYCVKWPGDALGDVRPTGTVLVPADQVSQTGSGITITAQKQNDIAQQIMETGWFGYGYLNTEWKFVPEHTIPANSCIPQLNRPVGILWFKPGMAMDVEEIDNRKNLGTRWMKKVIAMTVLEPNKRNLLRVAYRT